MYFNNQAKELVKVLKETTGQEKPAGSVHNLKIETYQETHIRKTSKGHIDEIGESKYGIKIRWNDSMQDTKFHERLFTENEDFEIVVMSIFEDKLQQYNFIIDPSDVLLGTPPDIVFPQADNFIATIFEHSNNHEYRAGFIINPQNGKYYFETTGGIARIKKQNNNLQIEIWFK